MLFTVSGVMSKTVCVMVIRQLHVRICHAAARIINNHISGPGKESDKCVCVSGQVIFELNGFHLHTCNAGPS